MPKPFNHGLNTSEYFAHTFTPTKTTPTLGKRKPPDSVHRESSPLLNKGIIPLGKQRLINFLKEQVREKKRLLGFKGQILSFAG